MTALLHRGGLRVAVAAAAVLLTVLLGSAPAAGSFVAVTGTGGSTVGTAASFCVSPGSQDVVVSNDAWTDENAAATPNATTTALQVQSAAGADRRTYLRFVLPGIPRHCRLSAAQLRLRASAPTAGRIVDVYRADPAQSPQWAAGTLSWSNQPALAGTPAGSASLGAPGVQTWDVTAHTQALYGGPNNGFVLKDRTEDEPGPFRQAYDEQSTVGGTVPVLRLTWA
jgi:hypothetical protein